MQFSVAMNRANVQVAKLTARDFRVPMPLEQLACTVLRGTNTVGVAVGLYLAIARVTGSFSKWKYWLAENRSGSPAVMRSRMGSSAVVSESFPG